MFILRNRFLNTASFLSAPNDPPGGKKPIADVVGEVEDTSNDTNDDNGAGTGEDAGDAGDGESGDGEGGDDTDGESDVGSDDDDDGGDDEDPDLAGFTPDQRKKIQAKIAKETRWRDRQLARTHAQRRSAEEDVRAAAVITGVKPGENLTAEQIEARARELANGMTAQDRYDAAANETHAKGLKAYGSKWKSALDKLPKLGGLDLADMKEIVETDNPEVVLFTLTDPDEYERVMSLAPSKRRTEFIKIGLKEPPKSRIVAKESKRPGDVTAPVRPVGGGRQVAAQQVNLYDPNLKDDDAWYAARNATRRKKFTDVA